MENNFLNKTRIVLLLILFLCIMLLGYTAFGKPRTPLPIVQQQITGLVTDKQGKPIPGATVIIKGSTDGTFTNDKGVYNITATSNDVLVFSFIGFKSEEVPVENQLQLDVILTEDVTALGEVTVNAGYYTVSEKERTGSISSIKAEEIEKQPVNNPLGAMQGYMSGVNIQQTTGVPGGGYNIEIRGKNFINGNTNPLYIIDGVPFNANSLASASVSGSINNGNVSPLNALNPSDIESIEVLKDADATAIYGSRAANGVVLITTRKGKSGTTQFQATINSGMGHLSHFLELMNTPQYLEIRKEGVENDGFGSFLENPAFDFVWPDLKTWDQDRYTDWQQTLLGGTAYRTKLQLSVSGGSDQTRFRISGAHLNETTVFPGDSKYRNTAIHSNLNHRSKNKLFALNLTSNYTVETNNLPRTDLTLSAYKLSPNAPALYDDEGQLNWEDNSWDNPLAMLLEKYKAQSNTLMANAQVSYQILPALQVKTNLGYNNYQMDSYKLMPSTARNPKYGFTPENYSSQTRNRATNTSWIIEPQLSWNHQWDDASISVLAGATFQQQTTDQMVLKATGFPNNLMLENLAAANTIEILNDGQSEYHYQSIFSRLNFNWRNSYILNLTGRRDGSSRFGSGKQFGNFWSLGLAWIFSNSLSLDENGFLNYGKLRGSYGTTGSDNIGDYKFLNTFGVSGNDYNGITLLYPTGIYNPVFGWETNKKLELALDLNFFKDRIILNSAWYQNRSSDQLVGIPLAATTGFQSLTGNFEATVENTGWEFDLRTVNIAWEDFNWTTTLNLTLHKNKLVAFPDLATSTYANKYVIGKPLTIVKLYESLGVDPQTGIYQFRDFNDDGVINAIDDKQWIEDLAPELYGGIGNTFIYKNLSLEVFFQFKKQKAYNFYRSYPTPGYNYNMPVELYDRWRNEGDDASIQRATFGQFPGVWEAGQRQSDSNKAVSDSSFLRMRNVTLSYQLPGSLSKVMDVTLYVQGQNLLTITNYDGPDPEQPRNYILPPLRQITLGGQLRF
ncbi:TonB-linked outer membrane protein, SusC/RagA family [Zhouia amylolytica]|uniref:TonB-linked outer membrane protein, SusC/RagA family n=1 Tax=Zhouia amylolytica TaxID=376730 RepID=A0A1I6QS34_9FLAO|nr:SusC/RagA family TonB-linked outer membrane protein [Zhouia amylolytica]SFS55307.1 TonB-linked outer membrane protein, SusC/RagA family [Zhouia amylolytica]